MNYKTGSLPHTIKNQENSVTRGAPVHIKVPFQHSNSVTVIEKIYIYGVVTTTSAMRKFNIQFHRKKVRL